LSNDRVDGGRQSGHVIPVAMARSDTFDLAHWNPRIGAIAYRNGSLGAGIEQQGVPYAANMRHQPQSIPEISAKQRLTGNRRDPCTNDVGELGDRE
jgi:hypothetical protein